MFTDSVGQRRIAGLHDAESDKLEVSSNLWIEVGLVRNGVGTALVGYCRTLIARIQKYADLGIDTFILSRYPRLEATYRVAELLFFHLDVLQPEILPPMVLATSL